MPFRKKNEIIIQRIMTDFCMFMHAMPEHGSCHVPKCYLKLCRLDKLSLIYNVCLQYCFGARHEPCSGAARMMVPFGSFMAFLKQLLPYFSLHQCYLKRKPIFLSAEKTSYRDQE